MKKYSQQYNQERKRVKQFLHLFHTLYKEYHTICDHLPEGDFDDIINRSLSLIKRSKQLNSRFQKLSSSIQKKFIRKWGKKYGERSNQPFLVLIPRLQKVVLALRTRKLYFHQKSFSEKE